MPFIGTYLYIPRVSPGTRHVSQIQTYLKSRATKEKYPWIRFDAFNETPVDFLKRSGTSVVPAPHDMQPRHHLIINTTGTSEELLAKMKSKWRYNTRLAEKKGVVTHYVTRSDSDFPQMLSAFYDLVEKTASRKGVAFHPKEHYAQMFLNIPEDMIALFVAEHDNHMIAANIVTFYGGTATYLHGGADDHYRKMMAPHLLQWQALRAAVGRGCTAYDFGGVYQDSSDTGKMGITNFKKGFSPETSFTSMAGSYDIVLSPLKYWVYRILQKIHSVM